VKATSFCDQLQERDEKQDWIATGANTGTNTGANTGESVPESFTTFNDLYESYREAFVSWLNRRVKSGDLSERTKKDYLSAVDRYLITAAEDDVSKPLDLRDMEGDKQTRGFRNFFNYLEDEEIDHPLGYALSKWRKNTKIRKSGVVEIYPSNREIAEAYNACPPEHKIIFKALVYTGNRFSQLYAALKDFNPDELTYAGGIAHISSAHLSHGTKRSYRLFFPAAFIPEISKISFQSEDNTKKAIMHGRISAKTIRKWHYNFMISHGVPQAAADFMQGRSPATVGSANYLDKISLSTVEYQKIVDLFPIPPTAGEKIPLPPEEDHTIEKEGPQPQPPAEEEHPQVPPPPKPEPKEDTRKKSNKNLIAGKNKKPMDEKELDRMLRSGMSHAEIIKKLPGANKTKIAAYVKAHPELKRK
jgi:intergrase/recombinase